MPIDLNIGGAYTWDPGKRVPSGLAAEFRSMAAWLGLERVEADDRGDLAPHLRRAGLTPNEARPGVNAGPDSGA
jgi:hypothetical protein